jgi:hypothetical protein
MQIDTLAQRDSSKEISDMFFSLEVEMKRAGQPRYWDHPAPGFCRWGLC